jgi:hypothetical protein
MSNQLKAITKFVASVISWSWSVMTSEELANQVTDCVESLRDRILGTGDDQYSQGDQQAIELKSNTQLVTEAIEELDDLIVYAVVLRSRMDNLRLSI